MKLLRSLAPPRPGRRAAWAASIGLATFLLLGGVLGLAAAHDEDAPEQDLARRYQHLQLPTPLVGDIVVYDRFPVYEDVAPYDILRWAQPEVIADHLGRVRPVNVLNVENHGLVIHDGQPQERVARNDLLFDTGSHEFVAYREHQQATRDSRGTLTSYGSSHNGTHTVFVNQSYLRYDYRGNVDAMYLYQFLPIPCGILNPLQQEPLGADGTVPLFAHCREALHTIDWPRSARENTTFRLTAEGEREGRRLLRFDLEDLPGAPVDLRRPNATVWIDPAIPYPIIVEHHTRPDSVYRHVLRSYDPGPIESAPATAPPVSDPLRLELKPALPWGPDDTGIQHPFPLSRAWSAGMNDPSDERMRRFIQGHPDATTTSASFNEIHDTSGTHRIWVLELSDGRESLRICPVQVDPPVGATTARREGLDESPNHTCNSGVNRAPSIDCVPHAFPTVASLARRWTLSAGEQPFNGWGFRAFCESVAPLEVSFEIGYYALELLPDVDPATGQAGWVTRREERDLSVMQNLDSRSFSVVSFRSAQRYTDLGQHAAAPAAGPAAPETVDAVPVTIWRLPQPSEVVGAGLAAVLLAAAYWLWPSLKHLAALPFYSRIDRPTALDQPVRARIQAAVEAQPGIHFQALARLVDIAPSTLDFHMRKLEQLGLVVGHHGHGYRTFFPQPRADRRHMEAAGALKAHGARRVLRALIGKERASASDLAKATGLARQTVHEHLARLRAAGLVETLEEEGALSHRPRAHAADALAAMAPDAGR